MNLLFQVAFYFDFKISLSFQKSLRVDDNYNSTKQILSSEMSN